MIPLIHRDLALDEKMIAVLTGLPVLLLGLAAIPGSLLIARIGARRALIVGLLLVALPSGLRGLGHSLPMLYGMTLLMGAGISISQPAIPTLIGRWAANKVGFATAVYVNGLLIGETFAVAFTIPLLGWLNASWEIGLACWAIPILLTALWFTVATPHVPRAAERAPLRWMPDWRNAQTWRLGLMQGGVSALYFGANAFIPDYFHATGKSELVGPCLTALNAAQLPASILVLIFARQFTGRKRALVIAALVALIGLAGMLVPGRDAAIVGAAILGFAGACVLILALALPPVLAAPDDVHRLSAGMFTIGYTSAFFAPLIGGAIWDATHIPSTAFVPVAVGGLMIAVSAATLRMGKGPGATVS